MKIIEKVAGDGLFFFKKNCSLEDSSKGQNVLTLTDVLDLGAALRATEEKQITASR